MPEKTAIFPQDPDIGAGVSLGFEYEVFSIRCPVARVFLWRVIPPGEQGMGVASVGENLPQSAGDCLGSYTTKRRRVPSGDHRGQDGRPGTLASFWELVPSLLA